MALAYTVQWCPLQPYIPVDLMCQAIKSAQSNKPDCPFTPPGWRQDHSGPSDSIHCYVEPQGGTWYVPTTSPLMSKEMLTPKS